MVVHRQGVAVPPNRGLLQLEKKGASDSTVCTALVTAMGWRCTGQGWRDTALIFQRAAKGDSSTALVTTLRVTMHRPMNSTLNGQMSVTNV
jgi:hypothetical protein